MAHLSGEMYTLIIEKQKNFVLQVSCSGDATGTGKSLAQSIWMITFHGEEVSTVSSITEAAAYQMLAKGQNIYGMIYTNVFLKVVTFHFFFSQRVCKAGWSQECDRNQIPAVGNHNTVGAIRLSLNG